MWALLRNVSGGVWKLSSTKPGSDGNATAVATPEKAPRVTNQSASTAKTQPAIDFARMSKHELEDQICQDFDGADPAVVMRLGHIILESGFGNNNGNGYKDPTTAAANESPNTAASSKKNSRYIFIGTALMNWASIHGFEMPVSMSRVLAFALTETWLSRGLSNEEYCLVRAKSLYETVLYDPNCAKDCSIWLEYTQTLLYLGDYDICMKAVAKMVAAFKGDPSLSAVLILNATAINFAAGNFDHAWKFLFRLIQMQDSEGGGVDTLLSKSELVLLLARIFERCGESQMDRAKEAYYMVYENIRQYESEFEIPSFEDWILDGALWSSIGDKCVSLGLYAIAADLYSQSIVRDRARFDTPKQWFLVAKAHFRSGQKASALMATREASIRDPSDELYKRAITEWTRGSNRSHTAGFMHFLSTWSLQNVMSLLRPSKTGGAPLGIRRGLEPFYYGEVGRKCLTNAPLAVRAEVAEGAPAKAGVSLALPPKDPNSSNILRKLHLIVSAKVHYASQSVRSIKIFDLRSNRNIVVKLKSPFKLPINLSQSHTNHDSLDGGPSILSSSMTTVSGVYNFDSSIIDVRSSRESKRKDDDEDDLRGVNEGFQVRLGQDTFPLGGALLHASRNQEEDEMSRLSASVDMEGDLVHSLKALNEFKLAILCKSIENIESRGASNETVRSSKLIVALRFVHKNSGRYSMRQLSLSFNPDGAMSVGETKNDTFGVCAIPGPKKRATTSDGSVYSGTPSADNTSILSRSGSLIHFPSYNGSMTSLLSPVREDVQASSPLKEVPRTPNRHPDYPANNSHNSVNQAPQSAPKDVADSSYDRDEEGEESRTRTSSFDEHTQSGTVSKLSSLASSYYNCGCDGPVRGSIRFKNSLYLFRFYAPEDDPFIDESSRHNAGAMSVHIFSLRSEEVLVFCFPPESVDTLRLARQLVFFLLSVAHVLNDLARMKHEALQAQRGKRKGLFVCGRYIIAMLSSLEPGFTRIYVCDPCMHPIISESMRKYVQETYGEEVVYDTSSAMSTSSWDSSSYVDRHNESSLDENKTISDALSSSSLQGRALDEIDAMNDRSLSSAGSYSIHGDAHQRRVASSRSEEDPPLKVRQGLEQGSFQSNDNQSISNTSSKSKTIIELGGNYKGADIQAMRAARASRAALDVGRLQITSATLPGLTKDPHKPRFDRKASTESAWSADIDGLQRSSSFLGEGSHITHHPGDELFYNAGLDVLRRLSKHTFPASSEANHAPNHENGILSIDSNLYGSYRNRWTFASLLSVFDPKWIEVGGSDCLSYALSQTILRRGVGPDIYINAPTQRTHAMRRKRTDSDDSLASSISAQDFLVARVDFTFNQCPEESRTSLVEEYLDDIETVSLKSDSHPSISGGKESTSEDLDSDEESISTVITRPVSIVPDDDFLENEGLSWNDSQLVGSLVDDAVQCALLKCDAISRASHLRVHRISNRRMSAVGHAIGGVAAPNARRSSMMRRPSAYRSSPLDAINMQIQSSRPLTEESLSRPRTATGSTSSNPNDPATILVPQTEEPESDLDDDMVKVPSFYVEEEKFVSKEVENSVMTFLLWQNRLADATEFLFCMGTHALSVESKKEAFDYLLQRVESAKEILVTRAASRKNIRVSRLKSKAMSYMMSKRRSSLPSSDEKPGRRASQDVIPLAPTYIMQNRAANKKMKPIRRASVAITIAKKIEDISHSINLREIQQRILKAELQRQEEEALAKKRKEEEERAAFLRIKPTDPLKDPALLVEVLSRTNAAMPLSYTAQLVNHRGGSVTWEDGLEDGQMGGFPAKERPNRSAKAKSAGRHRNPVHFLDDPSLDSFDAFNKSIGEYRSCGYPSGSREYFEVWSQKIKTSLDRFSTVGQLSRAMDMLRKNIERDTGYAMSRAEALCALAEAKGSTSEALGVLKDTSFLEEATSVSRSVPTDDIASILENACKLGIAAFFNSGTRGEKRRDGKRQGLTPAEALESRGLGRKEKDAVVFEMFKELVHKILDSQLSPDTIVQIAKVQGESDLSAASVFMPQVMAAMSAPPSFSGSGINSPVVSPGNPSRASGFLPSIEMGHRTPNAHNMSTDGRVSFAVDSHAQRGATIRSGARAGGDSLGLATSSSLSDLDVAGIAPLRSPPRVFAGSSSVEKLSLRTSGRDDTAHFSEWGSTTGAFGSMALNSHSIVGDSQHTPHSSNQKAVSDALRIERTIRRIMRSSLDDKIHSPEKVFSEKDMYKTKHGAKRGLE